MLSWVCDVRPALARREPTITTPPATHIRRSRVRPGLIVAGVLLLVACLAAWLFAPSLLVAPSTPVRWQLVNPGLGVTGVANGHLVFDEAATRAMTVIPVQMDWWPGDECPRRGDWLATPSIIYTPWSVTITMHTSSGFDPRACRSFYDFWGQPIEVRLSEPLAGRALFDGSTVPPAPRPYP
jgi:hypothetical protein